MARVSLADHMREHPQLHQAEPAKAGPFVTISRQFGCYGFSLGLLVQEILNEDASPESVWKLYHKDVLARLATDTNMAAELLEKERRSKPRLIVDFFRSLSRERIPSGYEIRNRITTIIRGLAIEGRAIIIGQGGAGATADLPNGLSIRLEAPEEWRIRQVALREGSTESQARTEVQAKEQEREYLRKIYERRHSRKPAFHLVYDCSVFTLAHIAQHIVYAMKLNGLL
ncbi:MAG TPA: cytidylate kinase-like family protein [Phycisphaerae bacterium]|nr:cytidylate kinase-like family protein [Phycisphaerae bacterium]HUT58462.1 cytidylate kinase-like family protein [Phycisphaerae bacterium]